MKAEQMYRDEIDKVLTQYFEIDTEVCSLEHRRIDYVLKCKKSGALFGLEVKHINHMRGEKMGQYLLQAADYARMYWKTKFCAEPVKMPIFISPAISNTVKQVIPESKIMLDRVGNYKDAYSGFREHYMVRHESINEHSNINSLIGSAFNIGEIRSFKLMEYDLPKVYFAFIFNNKPIWGSCDKARLHQVNYNFLINKLNTSTP